MWGSANIFPLPPLDTHSNSFKLYARFQQRERQIIEREKEHLLTLYCLHTEEERRERAGKKCPAVKLANFTGKAERRESQGECCKTEVEKASVWHRILNPTPPPLPMTRLTSFLYYWLSYWLPFSKSVSISTNFIFRLYKMIVAVLPYSYRKSSKNLCVLCPIKFS